VEDNKISQAQFKRWWQKKGHNVFLANNGQEAIELFKNATFSIIFLDIEMPIKNGLITAREIRAYEQETKRGRTPIIGVSGFVEKYQEKAIEHGMDDFISKGSGYQFNEIYDIVARYVGVF